MSMGGWDLVSLVDVSLINERLREAAGDVVQRFQYKEEDLRIRGVFGPWQIVPGGSRQKLHVDLPLKSGELRLHPGMQTRYPLKGLVLRVELALRIIEPTQGAGPRNLMFNLDRTGLMGAEQPVTVVDLMDPEGRIPEDDKRILSISLAACLKKHQDKIKFVFASVTSTAGLSMPNLDWAYLETSGAGQYLAIAGALDPMPADLEADSIGDGLVVPDMQGALGLSGRALCQKVVAPSMNQTFKPQNSFVGQANGVRLLRPVRLAPQKIDGYLLQPVLDKLVMTRIETGFDITVHAITAIKGDTMRLETDMKLRLKFKADQAKGSISLVLDGEPKQNTVAVGSGFWDNIRTFFVNIFLACAKDNVDRLATLFTAATVDLSTPEARGISWAGVANFKANHVRTDGFIYLAQV